MDEVTSLAIDVGSAVIEDKLEKDKKQKQLFYFTTALFYFDLLSDYIMFIILANRGELEMTTQENALVVGVIFFCTLKELIKIVYFAVAFPAYKKAREGKADDYKVIHSKDINPRPILYMNPIVTMQNSTMIFYILTDKEFIPTFLRLRQEPHGEAKRVAFDLFLEDSISLLLAIIVVGQKEGWSKAFVILSLIISLVSFCTGMYHLIKGARHFLKEEVRC